MSLMIKIVKCEKNNTEDSPKLWTLFMKLEYSDTNHMRIGQKRKISSQYQF